jgi:2-succinyl-6-hydroxy-2,4-cyclohexadiene-1-carboxylate synthase
VGVTVAIHGFLGEARDWDFLRQAGFDIRAVDLFRTYPLPMLAAAADAIVGYSMGGRLALQVLLSGATFSRAVIVSAGLGIDDPAERIARRQRDELWAQRFERDDWRELMHEWNAQPLFDGEGVPREESDFDRRALAAALREWSPAVLPPVAARLHEIEIPLLWIAGARDAKYVAEGTRAVELLPNAELWVCPDAGHRVMWDHPQRFVERMGKFLGVSS